MGAFRALFPATHPPSLDPLFHVPLAHRVTIRQTGQASSRAVGGDKDSRIILDANRACARFREAANLCPDAADTHDSWYCILRHQILTPRSREPSGPPMNQDFRSITAKIHDRAKRGEEQLRSLGDYNEADTQDRLVVPILQLLGYSADHWRRHKEDKGNYPDRICWHVAAHHLGDHPGPAALMMEEKPLDTRLRSLNRWAS